MTFYNDSDKNCVAWLEALVADGLIEPGRVDGRPIEKVGHDEVSGEESAHWFAGIAGWPLALQLADWPEGVPVWSGSCPCFAAGTLILTERGLARIEDVRVGDRVLTHRGRWRTVSVTMRSRQETVIVKGQGHWGLETTGEHPFLTGFQEWTPARMMAGKRWVCVDRIPETPISPMGVRDWRGKCNLPTICAGFWRFVGYWVGDGWLLGDRGVAICGGRGDSDLLDGLVRSAGLSGSHSLERTSSRVRVGSKILSRWMRDNFGSLASEKTVPAWMLGADREVIENFLDGLLLADGYTDSNGYRHLTTTSRRLAVGVRILFNRLGSASSIRWSKPIRDCVIEGRPVGEKGFYRVTQSLSGRTFKFDRLGGRGLVRSVEKTGETKDVYNIAVEEDESYIADGIVVHNCQPFSTAGKRKAHKDHRNVWPHFRDKIEVARPDVVFGEQVAGRLGLEWLAGVRTDLENLGYAVGWCELCAAGVGAPHKRQRLYWVAHARRGTGQRDAGTVLGAEAGERRPGQQHGHLPVGLEHGRPVSRLALSDGRQPGDGGLQRGRQHGQQSADGGVVPFGDALGVTEGQGLEGSGPEILPAARRRVQGRRPEFPGGIGPVADAAGRRGRESARPGKEAEEGSPDAHAGVPGKLPKGLGRRGGPGPVADDPGQRENPVGRFLEGPGTVGRGGAGFWFRYDLITCRDGKVRRVPEPRLPPMAHGLPDDLATVWLAIAGGYPLSAAKFKGRPALIRGAGNAIVPQLAAVFIRAFMDSVGMV